MRSQRRMAWRVALCLVVCAVVFSCGAWSSARASAVPDPTEQMKPFVGRIIALLEDPGLKKMAREEKAKRITELIREHFDFTEMSKRVLGPQWRQIDAQQQQEFVDLFTTLLQHIYIDYVDDYTGQQVVFTQQRIKGQRAEVQTLLVDKEKSIPVSYIMLLRGDTWMVYDVIAEGISLVRNYMEQFRAIVQQDGYPGLVRQIEEKIVELGQSDKQPQKK
jgi:phospholipid transport system substrate-binding protein